MRHLTKDELVALLSVSEPQDRLIFLLAFNHGLRVTEIVGGWLTDKNGNHKWYSGITLKNFVGEYFVIERLKGSCKTIQKICPNEAALLTEYLKTFTPGEDGRLFPISRKTVQRHIKTAGIEAGIAEFKCHPHVLKHTTTCLGLKGGMTLPEVQARLGHKSGASTMVYLAVDDDTASDAFAKAVSISL